eukprot:gnl/MRDRNA2_/MRDRNA2_77244_c0_seq1.p1 gnl/MRDRNA2_/MRDRNA2_77244_c0~~gnl/MRDRNA2_/MRDRNA2_77244_c0_seq1.p1  ORF type:complete len:1379 (-),score=249.20 gnl/MRDRNA2_/MRDRNA2_77244_c0_seq1:4-4140(-)
MAPASHGGHTPGLDRHTTGLEDSEKIEIDVVQPLRVFWFYDKVIQRYHQAVSIRVIDNGGTEEQLWDVILSDLEAMPKQLDDEGTRERKQRRVLLTSQQILNSPQTVPERQMATQFTMDTWLKAMMSANKKEEISTEMTLARLEAQRDSVGEETMREAPPPVNRDPIEEMNIGAILYGVKKGKRDSTITGLFCYCLMLMNFVAISTLLRPVHKMFEVQDALYGDIVGEAFPAPWSHPSGANFQKTYMDIANFGDFWTWVEGVLMDKVYAEEYYSFGVKNDPSHPARRRPHAMFTLAKYNRLLGPIRFRQVRVKPTLPVCPSGAVKSGLSGALSCTKNATFESCGTVPDSHELARPCWGQWAPAFQDNSPVAQHVMETKLLPFQKQGAFTNKTRSGTPVIPQSETLTLWSNPVKLIKELEVAKETAVGPDPIDPSTDPRCASFCDNLDGRPASCTLYSDLNKDANSCTAVLEFVAPGGNLLPKSLCRRQCLKSDSDFISGLSPFKGDEDKGMNYCGVANEELGGCAAHVVDLPLNATKAWEKVRAMKQERWTSEGTKAVHVEINTYNANIDLAVVMRILVEVTDGGLFEPHAHLRSCRLFPYSDSWTDRFRMFLEAIFFTQVMWYLYAEFAKLRALKLDYFKSTFNLINFINMVCFLAILGLWWKYNGRSARHFFTKRQSEFQDLWSLAESYMFIARLAAFNLLMGFVRILTFFQIFGRLMVLFDVLKGCFTGLISFMIVFIMILAAFAWSGHWCFGVRVEEFHTIGKSVAVLILSVTEGVEYEPTKLASPGAAPAWHTGWIVISGLVLVNFLIGIICDAFTVICEKIAFQKENEDIYAEVLGPTANVFTAIFMWIRERTCGVLPCFSTVEAQAVLDQECDLRDVAALVDFEKLYGILGECAENGEATVSIDTLAVLFNDDAAQAQRFLQRLRVTAKLWVAEQNQEERELTTLEHLENMEADVARVDFAFAELHDDVDVLIQAAATEKQKRRRKRQEDKSRQKLKKTIKHVQKNAEAKKAAKKDNQEEEEEDVKGMEVCLICCMCTVGAFKSVCEMIALGIFACCVHIVWAIKKCCSKLYDRVSPSRRRARAEARATEEEEERRKWAANREDTIEHFFQCEEERLADVTEMRKEEEKRQNPDMATTKFGIDPTTIDDELPQRGSTPPGTRAVEQGLAANKLHFWANSLVTAHNLHWESQPVFVKGLGLELGQKVPMSAVTHWDLRWLSCLAQGPLVCSIMCIGFLVPIILMVSSNKPPQPAEAEEEELSAEALELLANMTRNATNAIVSNLTGNETNQSQQAPELLPETTPEPGEVGNDPRNYKFFGLIPAAPSLGLILGMWIFCGIAGKFWQNIYNKLASEFRDSRMKRQLAEEALGR